MPYFIKLALLTTALVFPLAVFVWWRGATIFGALRWKKARALKRVYTVFLISFLIYPAYLLIWYYGDMNLSYNNQSRFLALYFWTGMVLITQLFWVLITLVAGLFAFKLSAGRSYQKLIRYIPVASSALILLVMSWVSWKAVYDMRRIVTEKPVAVDIKALDGGEELKIVHISDLQADVFTNEVKMKRYIDQVNAAEPDLVLFTGDLITEGRDLIPLGARLMGDIRSTYGVYAVFGDHDIWHGRPGIREAYSKYGITVLEDENKLLELPGLNLLLTGITQGYSVRISDQKLEELMGDSIRAEVRISMAHQPAERLVQQSVQEGYDLFLGGHTHGGQIVVPFFFMEINPARSETPYPVGSFEVDGLLVNVNAGLGASLSPLRFGAPAAVSTIILK